MAKFKHFGVISGALLLSGLLAGCALQRGIGSPEDANITARVEALLRQYPDLSPPNEIDVATRDHVVYLSGLAVSPLGSENAEALAREVPGVTKVVSTISLEQ